MDTQFDRSRDVVYLRVIMEAVNHLRHVQFRHKYIFPLGQRHDQMLVQTYKVMYAHYITHSPLHYGYKD